MSPLAQLCDALRASRGFAHKTDIVGVVDALAQAAPAPAMPGALPIGDDCAAWPDGHGGHQLLAIEGLVEDFIERMPWFAGYCAVMVNVSDIYAMGGRPTAVVNALWSPGMKAGAAMLEGMATACARYGVPMVGGHSNNRSARPQLAVAICGQARRLLTSFDARPGDVLLMAVDLRGAWQEPFPYWNASTEAPAQRLRDDLELLPALAEDGLCAAAKDISMAGAIGTALMLLDTSQAGAQIDVDAIPRPPGVDLLRWLTAFPSYGFILSLPPDQVAAVQARFAARDLAAAVIGQVDDSRRLLLRQGGEQQLLWDLAAQPFVRPAARTAAAPEPAHV
ncbi:MAG: sll0787 family AIR synthase-like protein [Comamonadaceae bacterium]|nr:MAG: sll0787 family AIR synthase-like protein [Comamonadaceae bacterium]